MVLALRKRRAFLLRAACFSRRSDIEAASPVDVTAVNEDVGGGMTLGGAGGFTATTGGETPEGSSGLIGSDGEASITKNYL